MEQKSCFACAHKLHRRGPLRWLYDTSTSSSMGRKHPKQRQKKAPLAERNNHQEEDSEDEYDRRGREVDEYSSSEDGKLLLFYSIIMAVFVCFPVKGLELSSS